MYFNPQQAETIDIYQFVQKEHQELQRVFELARRKLKKKQKRRYAFFCKKVHGRAYKKGQKVLPYHPAIAAGTTSKFVNPWKGPCILLKNV